MTHKSIQTLTFLALVFSSSVLKATEKPAQAVPDITPLPRSANLEIKAASVTYIEHLDLLVFEQKVRGEAGGTVPAAKGQMDGAPVLGYVFPTTLQPQDVGFGAVEGTLALALTSHPDFDDTPLWDENSDRNYANDGVVFHTHWVVLVADKRVPGGLKVRETAGDSEATLPPTNPGMPMYLDSPGFSAVLRGDTLKILVPAQRVSGKTSFQFDAVSVYMQVAQSGDRPVLGVYEVYGVLSGDLSLPYSVDRK